MEETSVLLIIGPYVHKLNGLVGGIRTWIKIIQRGEENLLKQEKELAAALEKIEDSASKILSLTEEFRASFLSSQVREAVSINTIIIQAIKDSVLPDSIETAFESDNEIPDVHADKNLIDVFRNLFTNAVEAMPDGGRLKIVAKINSIKNSVEITIADTGRGIPSYVVDSVLFQPYFSTKEQQGHGLGLWWSKIYLENIGGQISILSTDIGIGTTFLVSIPLYTDQ